MPVNVQRYARFGLGIAFAFALAFPSFAFFPFGGSSEIELQLVLIRWDFRDFDRNSDGDVSGPNDGIDMTFEGGPDGWTDEEMTVLEDSFDEWENVTTSYVAFTFLQPIEDPAEVLGGVGSDVLFVDGINLVAIQLPNDVFREPAADAPGVLGIANIDFQIDDGFFTSPDGSITIPISGGRIIECDIVINGLEHRPAGEGLPPAADLKGTVVHEIGHLLGIGHNPMNNLELNEDLGLVIESPVMSWRDENGLLVNIGVTPTMFPSVFTVDDPLEGIVDGGQTLAVDDIAAATFRYPRTGPNRFFTISHFARSQARPGFPTVPVLGGLVTAWVDADNNPGTPRVPLVSTMTGLYEHNTEAQDRGDFHLRGLPMELESAGSPAPFEANYTLTFEPLGARLPFQGAAAFDSTHILRPQDAWPFPYDAAFQSEVFHVDDQFFGRNNFDAGTPLTFDQSRGRVVNASTGDSLDQMLPRGFPMFGERSEICPLLVIQEAAGVTFAPTALRGFRDDVLLQTALGASVVDAYYRAGPHVAHFLLDHELVLTIASYIMRAFEWTLLHQQSSLVIAIGLGALVMWRFRRRRAVVIPLLIMGTAAISMGSSEISAAVRYMTDAQKAEAADAIVQGTVVEVESLLRPNRSSVETATVISVVDEMKGGLNKGSAVDLRLPGGRVGDLFTHTTEMPTFQVGDEVLLYLYFVEGHGYVVVGGFQGKTLIRTNPDTGAKYVENTTFLSPDEAAAQGKSADEVITVTKDAEGHTPLEDLKAALREVVKQQEGRSR